MAISQKRAETKPSGGGYKHKKGKKLHELGRIPTLTKIDEKQLKQDRVRGGNTKQRLIGSDVINLMDPKTKKAVKAKIKVVKENPANRHYVRRNILTKGTIVDTDKGKAMITSRPGQEGTVNGVLIS